jgi:hypothetical protein
MTTREKAVLDGRAAVRVRDMRTGKLLSIGVCPACWNTRERRATLLAQIEARGLAVVHGADGAGGAYPASLVHAPTCPWRNHEPRST